MARLNASNNAESTLINAISSSDTLLTVGDASLFPSVPFRLSIGTEIVEVTSVSGNDFTVERGKENTTASSFDAGEVVQHRLTAGSFNELVSEDEMNGKANVDHSHEISDVNGLQSELDGKASQTEFTAHKANRVTSQDGSHGLRYDENNELLEYLDGNDEWQQIQIGGSDIQVGNVTDFNANAGNTDATLTWQDPPNLTVTDDDGNEVVLAEWQGTKILRKEGSYPANENDGVLVVDNGIQDQYANDGFVDAGLTNDTTYYYMAFPYTSENVYTVDEANRVEATPQAYQIYGVKIDTTNSNPETAVTYTDDALGLTPANGGDGVFNYGSWADKFPFNQIKPCVLQNGAVNYYLNPDDYTQKEDGSSADITSGADGDVMVEFPKIWWKFERVGDDLFVRYADAQIDSSYVPLAHTRGSTEKDKIYVGAYLGWNDSGTLRSLSGKTPTADQTIGTFRNQAQNNGTGYEQMPFYPLTMLQVLYLVMFKNRDSQTALGEGYTDSSNSSSTSTGGTDAKGLFYGSSDGAEQVKFCGIEDFYGNLRYWIDGVFYDDNYDMLIGTDNFNDTGSGYTNHGATGWTTDDGGYVDGVQGANETGFIPASTNGSETTHYADYGYIGSARLPGFGGRWSDGSLAGAFALRSYAASASLSLIGARACFV